MRISQDRLSNLAVNTGVGVTGRVVGRFLSVIESLVAARVLGPASFGLYALGLTIFRLIELISPLGFDVGIIRYGSAHLLKGNYRALKGTVAWSSIVSLLFSTTLGIILFGSSSWLASTLFKQDGLTIVFQLFAPIIPLSGLLAIFSSTSRLKQQIKYSVIVQDVGPPLFALIALFVFWILGLNLQAVIVADQISYFLSVLLGIFVLRKILPFIFEKYSDTVPPNKEYYSFSLTSSASIFFSTLVLWVDRLLSGVFLSALDVGIYQAALQISVIFAILMSSFSRILLPIFSSLYANGELGELQDVFRISTKWSVYLSLPIVVFLFLNPESVLVAVYGEAYSIGGQVLSILLIGQLINLSTGAVGPLLLVGGHHRTVLLLSGAILFTNVLLCSLLIPRFGLIGAALSNTVSIILMYSIALIAVRLKMSLWPYDLHYWKGIASIGFASICAIIIKFLFVQPSLGTLAFQFVIMNLAFTLSLYWLGFSHEDRIFMTTFLRRLRISR